MKNWIFVGLIFLILPIFGSYLILSGASDESFIAIPFFLGGLLVNIFVVGLSSQKFKSFGLCF